jgi:hypothetical protein
MIVTGLGQGGDDAAIVQAAILANPGARVDLPAGDLTFRSPVVVHAAGTRLIGAGIGATRIVVAYSGAGDVVALDSAPYSSVEDLQLVLGGGFEQRGALIRVANGHNCQVRNISTAGAFFCHLAIDGGPDQYTTHVDRVEFNPTDPDPSSAAIIIGQNGLPQDTWLDKVTVGGNSVGNCAVLVLSSGGLNARDISIINCAKQGLVIYPGVGQAVRNTFLFNFQVDTCAQRDPYSGALAASNGGQIYDLNISSSWFSSNGQRGSGCTGLILADVENGRLMESDFYWNDGPGYFIDPRCKNIVQRDNMVVPRP